ncbi:MAG: TetR/AcrR family transcriptional regulator [Myxococcota bacterium]
MGHYWEAGPQAVSLNELCRRIGISKPGLYREFGDEDALMTEVLRHYRTVEVEPLLAMLERSAWQSVIAGLLDATTTGHGAPAGCLFTKFRFAEHRLGPKTARSLGQIVAERRSAFAERFAVAQAAGEAPPELTRDLAAHYLDTQLSVILMQMATEEPRVRIRAQGELALGVLVVD